MTPRDVKPLRRVYYNENNDAAADWLENLIAAGQIAPGHVDRRSIKDVQPDDLHGFAQHHFFAGIGGWSLACRIAGWPDDRPIWTASCPCQPFSVAGKGAGEDDPRHLWPDVLRLLRSYRPAVLVGEQVAGKAGYGWFDGVRASLEGENYASRAVDIPALAVDGPHERNRQYWVAVADADSCGRDGREEGEGRRSIERASAERAAIQGVTLGDAQRSRLERQRRDGDRSPGRREQDRPVAPTNDCGALADREGIGGRSRPGEQENRGVDPNGYGRVAHSDRSRQFQREGSEGLQRSGGRRDMHGHGRNGSWWAGADWIICHDGKARRVADAGAPLLVNGVRGRVAIPRPAELCPTAHQEEERWVSRIAAWSGFGNAIVPPLAAEVIGALMDALAAKQMEMF